jgi:hypothetical protein
VGAKANKIPVQKTERSLPVSAIVIGLVAILGLGMFLYLDHASKIPPSPPVLTPEAKAYVRNLKLSDVGMEAHESYLKQAVTEITGKIGNTGPRRLKHVEINCVFYDAYGQVVLRERVPIVKEGTGLAPGETRDFRLAFDNLPESWNQAMPQMVIAQIVFG